jgi:hypothetical protein
MVEKFDGNFDNYIKLYTTTIKNNNKDGTNASLFYDNYKQLCDNINIKYLYDNQSIFTRQFKKYEKNKSNGNTKIIGLYIKTEILTSNKNEIINEIETFNIKDHLIINYPINNTIEKIIDNVKINNLIKLVNDSEGGIEKVDLMTGETLKELLMYKKEIKVVNCYNDRLKSVSELVGFSEKWTLAIKANCGMGKTQELIAYIKSKNIKKILIISFRKSLVAKQFEDFKDEGFKSYIDFNTPYIQCNRLIVQIESLHRVFGSYDLVVVDEFRSVCSQLVQNSKNKRQNVNAFQEHLKYTDMVYIADAFFNNSDVEYLNSLNRDNQLMVYHNYHKKHSEKFFNYAETKELLTFKILEAIQKGENIIIATGSKNYGEIMYEIIKDFNKDIKIKIYTGGDRYETDPIQEWFNYQVIIFTSCICAGNSFTEEHFSSVFGYFPSVSVNADLAVQMIMRCRNYKNLYMCIAMKGAIPIKNCYNRNDIRKYICKMDNIVREDFEIYVDKGFKDDFEKGFKILDKSYRNEKIDIKSPYFVLYSAVLNRANNSKRKYLKIIMKHFHNMGFVLGEVVVLSDIPENLRYQITDIKEKIKNMKEFCENEKYEKVASAKLLTYYENEDLQNKKFKFGLTKDEYNSTKKYKIFCNNNITEDTITTEYVKIYDEKSKMLYNVNTIIKHSLNDIKNDDEYKDKLEELLNNITNYIDDGVIENELINPHIRSPNIRNINITNRLEENSKLIKTNQVVIVYNMLKLFVNDKNYDIFRDETEKLFDRSNIHLIDNYIMDKHNVAEFLFNTKGLKKIFEMDKETKDIKYKSSIEIIERNNIIRTWLNLKANELFGIKLLIHKKDNKKIKICREYRLKQVGNSQYKVAVFKNFYETIKFQPSFIKYYENKKYDYEEINDGTTFGNL